MKIQVYDPPMCCASGVCGPTVDPTLVQLAADLEWLREQGVTVERYNLTQQPAAFVANPVVKDSLTTAGNDCLPLTLADGAVVSEGEYPSREALAGFAGHEVKPSLFTDAVRELVAIGAAIASNCEPCFKHHYNEAPKLGVSKEDMRLAVDLAQAVKDTPARDVLELAQRHLGEVSLEAVSCCGSAGPAPSGTKCC